MVSETNDQTHVTPNRPSSGRGGKTVTSPPIDNLVLSKKKEKVVISSKDGFDYLTCSRRELEDRILDILLILRKFLGKILSHKLLSMLCLLEGISLISV